MAVMVLITPGSRAGRPLSRAMPPNFTSTKCLASRLCPHEKPTSGEYMSLSNIRCKIMAFVRKGLQWSGVIEGGGGGGAVSCGRGSAGME